MEALTKSGALKASGRLQPTSTATTVKVTKRQNAGAQRPLRGDEGAIGRYFLIDVPDLDSALSWAARCPASGHGTVEVRPIWVM